MRKRTRIAAIVYAAALLALGASIFSFAATKGTWMLVDGGWYCYDRNGDVYENTFCSSNGKEYYAGDDGVLVPSDWVAYDRDRYFVNSSGQEITNDRRSTTSYDGKDTDEEWYYFRSNGKMTNGKKIVWKNNIYHFDTNGKTLTAWAAVNSWRELWKPEDFLKIMGGDLTPRP